MKCDELKVYKVYTTRNEGAFGFCEGADPTDIELEHESVCLKSDVDAAIAELKARIQLDDDEMAGFLQLEEECGGGDLRNYIAELKQKLSEKDAETTDGSSPSTGARTAGMRKKSYKTVNLTKINIAHREACAKHPKFCDDFTGASEWFIVDELERWRKVNSGAPYHADAILNEEILEALEAYKQGNLKHCLQELSQCGAVILRMMQFVHDEMEA